LPPYLRKAKSIEELLPWLYLKGISTGDFHEALAALLGPNAAGLSSTTISRLKADWWGEYDRWQRRDLSTRRFVYIWADGVYFRPRMAEEKQCVLVLIGADEWGRKEIIGLADGYRESTQSWRELLLDLQRRGLTHAPDLAIGDGALGFWHALREVFGATKEQRCWFHKTGNVLNAMPKSVQAKAKGHLHDIWQAETRVDAEAAFDFFVTTYGVKYDKAVGKLTKDRDVLLAFYDFPAEHWKHVRTTNPIESTFATVRHRTGKTKGCLSRKNWPCHGVQTDDVSPDQMAQTRRSQPYARDHRRDCIQRRDQATSKRRLITPSPTFGHSSISMSLSHPAPPSKYSVP
jgi:transposase-like protein